jgi:hypothetical protein
MGNHILNIFCLLCLILATLNFASPVAIAAVVCGALWIGVAYLRAQSQ